MTRAILLNGPRQVGKDFIADKYIDLSSSARKIPVMWPGKLAAMAEYGVPPSPVQIMERFKDAPISGVKDFHGIDVSGIDGKTPRQVYIEYGQRMRAEHGEDYFADLWQRHVHNYKGYRDIVVPDVRFQPEVEAAVREFGAHNVLLVRVHQDDFDWKGDIGSYCTHWQAVDFDNTPQSDNVGHDLQDIVGKLMV